MVYATAKGRLSAYCGAVSVVCGSGAGITYLHGGGYKDISRTIVNIITSVGRMASKGMKDRDIEILKIMIN